MTRHHLTIGQEWSTRSHVVTAQRCTLTRQGEHWATDWRSTEGPWQAKTWPSLPWRKMRLLMTMPLTGEVTRWLTLTTSSNRDAGWNPGKSGPKRLSGRKGTFPWCTTNWLSRKVTETLPHDATAVKLHSWAFHLLAYFHNCIIILSSFIFSSPLSPFLLYCFYY